MLYTIWLSVVEYIFITCYFSLCKSGSHAVPILFFEIHLRVLKGICDEVQHDTPAQNLGHFFCFSFLSFTLSYSVSKLPLTMLLQCSVHSQWLKTTKYIYLSTA